MKDNRYFLKLLLNLPKEAKNNCPKGFNQLQQGLCAESDLAFSSPYISLSICYGISPFDWERFS